MRVDIPAYEIGFVGVRRFDDADKPAEKGIYQIEIVANGTTTSVTFLGSQSILDFVDKLNKGVADL